MNGKLKAILLLGLMFGLGTASGMVWQKRHSRHEWNPQRMFAESRIKRLSSKLNLSAEQEASVRNVFQKAHERAVKMNEKVTWDLAEIHRDTVRDIRKILTPEQLVRFEKMHDRFHDHHKRMPEDATTRPDTTKKS